MFVFFSYLKLLDQVKALEQAISHQSGERDELIGKLDQIQEDHTSADNNTESMVGKIQVRGCYLLCLSFLREPIIKKLAILGFMFSKHYQLDLSLDYIHQDTP